MTDTTNIIATQTRIEMMLGALNACRAPEYHQETLTALVAERDALAKRVAELEKSAFYIPSKEPPADRDRELRDRLICVALTGLCADFRFEVADADRAVAIADRTLAAMRKGEA